MPDTHGGDIIKAGDYKINKMVLRSGVDDKFLDIRGLYSSFEIYEDLFSPYMTAKIYMIDSLNIPEVLPIRGQEVLELEFQSDIKGIDPIKKIFRVYKIDRQTIDENGRGQEYVLHLMSEGGYYNYTERCGYSVKGKVSDMIGQIFEKHFPKYIWEDKLSVQQTNDDFTFVLPSYYTPFKAITFLSRRGVVGVAEEYSPLFFYETIDGYNFKSLSKIIEEGEESKEIYYFTKSNVNKNPDTGESSGITVKGKSKFPGIYHRIQSLEEQNRFDMIENITSGLLASKLTVYDMLLKEKRDQIFKESEVFDTMKRLGKKPHLLYGNQEQSNEMFTKSTGSYYYLPFIPRVEEYYLKRRYMVNTMMTQKLTAQIYGDSTKRVGQIIELFVPKIASDGHLKEEKDDKNLSGDYMITSICHSIGKRYMCRLELSRNAMGV